jgi:type IV secretion system protein VirB1
MTLSAYAMALLLSRCAPDINITTFSSIVSVESGFDPLAIHDNATGRSYHPSSRTEALAIVDALANDSARSPRCIEAHARDRSCTVDVGLGQINSSNFASLGFTGANLSAVLDPCRNVAAGATILRNAWETAGRVLAKRDTFGRAAAALGGRDAVQVRLRAAIAIYNANSVFANPRYVSLVVHAVSTTPVRDIAAAAKTAAP